MTNIIYTIYKTTNIINNKIYIGAHQTENPNDSYLGSGLAILRSIKKHGSDNFNKEILFEFDNSIDMFKKESEIVTLDFIKRTDTYNLCLGGKGGDIHTEETKIKIGLASKGKTHTDESKQKMSKSQKGRIFSDEHKKKMSDAHLGRKHTEESKIKISEAKSGKNNHAFKGYYITPYGKFESSRQASTTLISITTIQRWCNKYPDKIISRRSIGKSPYLKSLTSSPLGKTFREIGFDFESK